MSVLPFLLYPDQRLRSHAKPVILFDSELEIFIQNLTDTLYHANAIGLAGTLVNYHHQIIAFDTSPDKTSLTVMINPVVLEKKGKVTTDEGSVCMPGFSAKIERAAHIIVRYKDAQGKEHEGSYTDLDAVCIQHEIDYFSGKLFIDYLSYAKRSRFEKWFSKT